MNIVCTGASKGLGFEIAKKFVSEGHNVAVCSRSFKSIENAAEKLESYEKNKRQIIFYESCDVSDEDDVKLFINMSLNEFKTIDVLVNNAGVYGPKGKIEDVDIDDWKLCIDTNLIGPFNMMKYIIPHMKENEYGKIINIAGGGATQPLPFISAYAASKAGLVRLSESIAKEVKDYNIDINCVSPGLLETDMYDEIIKAGPNVVGKEFYDMIVSKEKTPLSVGVDLCYWLATLNKKISGKLISAVWDPKNLCDYIDDLNNSDIYTLRRIVPEDRNKNWSYF